MSVLFHLSHLLVRFETSFGKSPFGRPCERGQATAEYGVVILVAVALGMAVLSLFTGGVFDSFLGSMIKQVLKAATDKIDFT